MFWFYECEGPRGKAFFIQDTVQDMPVCADDQFWLWHSYEQWNTTGKQQFKEEGRLADWIRADNAISDEWKKDATDSI